MIIGIDLGTTNSLVSVWKEDQVIQIPNSLGAFCTPSVVSIEDGEIIVGAIAKERLITNPENTVANFKQFMGTNKKFNMDTKEFNSVELSSFVIKQLKEDAERYLNEEVVEAIISVPAYFNNKQRSDTKLAGELAGLKVERIINEPTAAIVHHSLLDEKEKVVLVFDFGGGTLDVSVVDVFENIVDIISTSGDNHLGGNNFDEMLLEDFIIESGIDFEVKSESDKQIFLSQMRTLKEQLSNDKIMREFIFKDNTYYYEIDEEKFIYICAKIFDRINKVMLNALRKCDLNVNDIDEILMVGGSSKLNIVQKFIKHTFQKQPILYCDCEMSVAKGCAIIAGVKSRSTKLRDIVVSDVSAFSIGVGVTNHKDEKKPLFMEIIKKNETLPVAKKKTFYPIDYHQNKMKFEIFQGDEMYAKDNHKLGEISCFITRNLKGEKCAALRLSYDINGILVVEAIDSASGFKRRKVFLEEGAMLSEKAMQDKIKALTLLSNKKKISDEDKYIIAWGKRLYKETSEHGKRFISHVITEFEEFIKEEKESRIRIERKRITELFQQLEGNLLQFAWDCEEDIKGFVKKVKAQQEKDEGDSEDGNSGLLN